MDIDREYNPPAHEYHVTEEYDQPHEVQTRAAEFNSDTAAFDVQVAAASLEKRKAKRTRTLILQTAAAITAIVIAKDSFSIDLLRNDIFNDHPSSQQEEETDDGFVYPVRDDTLTVAAHVRCIPDGGSFVLESKGISAIKSAREIAKSWGFDPDSMEVYKVEYTYETTIDGKDYYTHHAYINFYKKDYVPPEEEPLDEADAAFPVLGNLYPNGPVPTYGSLGEDFGRFENPATGKTLWAHAGDAYKDASGKKPSGADELAALGARYDYSSNTLYLNNFRGGGGLNVNWMGNGFKIVVTGDCELDFLLSWGFMWGGSVTITGDGTLTVNKGLNSAAGILIRAENSESCLMIDKDVTVDAYGKEAAVYIMDTTAEKSIYYLYPMKIGRNRRLTEGDGSGIYASYIAAEDGSMAAHICFSK